MKSINDLLDAIKDRHNIDSDSALGRALGVKRQTVSNWRHGHNTPDAVACATIAGLSGEPLALVLGLAGEQRAVSREEKAVWRKLAATAALLAVMVSGVAQQTAQAAIGHDSLAPTRHYAKWYVAVDPALDFSSLWQLRCCRPLRICPSYAPRTPHLAPTNAPALLSRQQDALFSGNRWTTPS